jgi:hypothetical protein
MVTEGRLGKICFFAYNFSGSIPALCERYGRGEFRPPSGHLKENWFKRLCSFCLIRLRRHQMSEPELRTA